MLPSQLYFLIMGGICLFALFRGGHEERVVAITSIVASVATVMVLSPLESRYGTLELGVLAIDLMVLLIFVALALRSRRFWPLWVAGIQLTTSFAHAIKATNIEMLPSVYAVAAQFWIYPILLILLVATWRTPRGKVDAGADLAAD